MRHQRFAEVPYTTRAEATPARKRCPRASTVEIRLTAEHDGTLVEVEHRDVPGPQAVAHSLGWDHYLSRLCAVIDTVTLLIDGEVVAFDGDRTSFSRLQQRVGVANPPDALLAQVPVVYCVLHLLEPDGEDHTSRPLAERRARLEKAIRTRKPLQVREAWRGDSEQRYAQACRSGWDRLIARRADARYVRGRSRDWLKLKCVLEQEFVAGGYTDPAGSRTDFGAPVVGYYEDSRLRYAGKVGTGYSAQTLRSLGGQRRKLETGESSFADARPVPRGTHLTRPELVAQVGFAEWTGEGRLRQPRFLGLRDDKRPAEVVREQPS